MTAAGSAVCFKIFARFLRVLAGPCVYERKVIIMNETTSTANAKYNLIAAISFTLLALLRLVFMTAYAAPISLFNLLLFAGYAVLIVSLFMGNRNLPLPAGFLLLTVTEVIDLLLGFRGTRYFVSSWLVDPQFNIFVFLPYLVNAVACLGTLFVVATALTEYFPEQKETVKKFWFLPAVLCGGAFVLAVFSNLAVHLSGGTVTAVGSSSGSLYGLVFQVLRGLGMLFSALWAVYPDGLPLSTSTAGVRSGDGYCGMVKHLLLLLFTFGVWYFIWIYRTTGYLNRVEGAPKQHPGHQVLFCLFIPFYKIYWAYKNAERLDKLSDTFGISFSLTTLCLLLQIINPFIPSMLIQDRINTIAALNPVTSVPCAASGLQAASHTSVGASVPVPASAAFPVPADDNPDELPEL